MENTKIEWATHTFNPWVGCAKVHTGCLNCYAESSPGSRVLGVRWGTAGCRVKTSDRYWEQPYRWNKDARDRPRVFPSLCDVFEDWRGEILDRRGARVYAEPYLPLSMAMLRSRFFRVVRDTQSLDWLLLTKRPQNVCKMLPSEYLGNVWLLYSASDQQTVDGGGCFLRKHSPNVGLLGLSLEPLIDRVDLSRVLSWLDWVIVGGESGPNARPCEGGWVEEVLIQCRAAGVPCFVKQMGSGADFRHKRGEDPQEWQKSLRVREIPSHTYK